MYTGVRVLRFLCARVNTTAQICSNRNKGHNQETEVHINAIIHQVIIESVPGREDKWSHSRHQQEHIRARSGKPTVKQEKKPLWEHIHT